MTGRKLETLGAAMAIGTAVLLAAAAVPAEARDGHRHDRGRNDRGRHERVYRDRGGAQTVYRHRSQAERIYRDHGRAEKVYRHRGQAERIYRDHGRAEKVYRHRGQAERIYRDHGRGQRVYRRDRGGWVAPPLLARPHRLPRARSFTVPRYIRGDHWRAYQPYYAGRVFYAPYGVDLDLFYFPVWVGGRWVYEPHYYYGPDLLFSIGAGGPHFFFQIGF